MENIGHDLNPLRQVDAYASVNWVIIGLGDDLSHMTPSHYVNQR